MPPAAFATPPTPSGARRRFMVAAGVNVLIYAVMWVFYSIPELHDNRLNRELLLWPVTLALLYFYWSGFKAVKAGAIPTAWVVASGLLMSLLAVMVPPFHSTDIFGYINRGWQQFHYGMNPYVHTVDHIPGWEKDPMITDHWVNNPSPYGFVYLIVAKGLTALGGGDKAATLTVFKLFNLLAHYLIATLVWLGVKRLNPQNNQNAVLASLYLYGWNPLVLIHGLSNGHNDMLMGLLVTLSAFFAIIGSWLWIVPALVGATLVKYGALVIIPFALLFLMKQRAWGSLIGGLAVGAALFLGTGSPYLGDFQSMPLKQIERNAFVSHGSLHSVVYSIYKTIGKEFHMPLYDARELARSILKNILLGCYALFYGWLAFRRLRQPVYALKDWLQDALLVMVVMICLVSLKFYPWYLGMFFPLAFYLDEGHWLRRFVVVLSGTQLFALTFIGQAHLINFVIMTGAAIAWLVYDRERDGRNTSTGQDLQAAS